MSDQRQGQVGTVSWWVEQLGPFAHRGIVADGPVRQARNFMTFVRARDWARVHAQVRDQMKQQR